MSSSQMRSGRRDGRAVSGGTLPWQALIASAISVTGPFTTYSFTRGTSMVECFGEVEQEFCRESRELRAVSRKYRERIEKDIKAGRESNLHVKDCRRIVKLFGTAAEKWELECSRSRFMRDPLSIKTEADAALVSFVIRARWSKYQRLARLIEFLEGIRLIWQSVKEWSGHEVELLTSYDDLTAFPLEDPREFFKLTGNSEVFLRLLKDAHRELESTLKKLQVGGLEVLLSRDSINEEEVAKLLPTRECCWNAARWALVDIERNSLALLIREGEELHRAFSLEKLVSKKQEVSLESSRIQRQIKRLEDFLQVIETVAASHKPAQNPLSRRKTTNKTYKGNNSLCEGASCSLTAPTSYSQNVFIGQPLFRSELALNSDGDKNDSASTETNSATPTYQPLADTPSTLTAATSDFPKSSLSPFAKEFVPKDSKLMQTP